MLSAMTDTTKSTEIPRSPELLSRHRSGLLVVDVQEKLIGSIDEDRRVVWNIGRLLDAARLMGVPIIGTEQYPQGLGATIGELRDRTGACVAKRTFSCGGCAGLLDAWVERSIDQVLVVGIEAHVCVLQTVMDLLHAGFRVYVPVDAVGSRSVQDRETALRRMEAGGATLVSTESVMFEWCETSAVAEFKAISLLVRQLPPAV
jgi:nicotinamidase-related amidase